LARTAVLYRSHFHALDIQLELTRRGIPFSITSGIRFFEQAHIKDVTAYLRLVLNPQDEAAFKRLVQLLPAIGAKGADKLWSRFSTGANVADHEADPTKAGARQEAPVATALARVAGFVPKKGAVAWAQFLATIAQLEAPELRQAPGRMIKWVVEAGYEDYAKAEFPNYRSRLDDLEQVAAFARQFAGTEEFLAQLALLTNLEAEAQAAPKEERELRLSTIHQAKGLEFDTVFVVMLCDGMFPSARSLEELEDEEEERRLFYVAITRARNELYLSYPLMRLSAEAGYISQEPSRFLGNIPRELLEELDLRMADPYG
jgi:DNA helicase-2/ATP-dependent DNA helicase PcrA